MLERVDSPWKVGAHVSTAGGVENAITNAVSIGSVPCDYGLIKTFDSHTTIFRANSFALFLKSHRKWTSVPLTPESILNFKKRMKQYGYANNMVLPHGNYLINLGNPDKFVPLGFYIYALPAANTTHVFFPAISEKSLMNVFWMT